MVTVNGYGTSKNIHFTYNKDLNQSSISNPNICHSHSFIADNKIRHVIRVLASCERVYHNDEVSEDGNLDWLVSISLSKDTDAVIH